MPRSTDITLEPHVWTQLTNADVTAIRAQMRGTGSYIIKGAVGQVPPTDGKGAIELLEKDVLTPQYTLADLWPGMGANRVYALARERCVVSVAHA